MTIYEEPFGRLRPFGVGFDEMFKKLDAIHNQPQGNYPPYNIVKLDEESFVIEIAAAGFSKKDFKIDLKDSSLKVKAEKGEAVEKEFIHQGIAARSFERVFALAEHVKVKDATYSDGILAIKLIREIPEAEKPIEIKVK
jgi:molecular chaperone IbpA|tara:strand:- start:241 stop:657 length:417 start_codon:yes stop_codon:yes gene_type:complete